MTQEKFHHYEIVKVISQIQISEERWKKSSIPHLVNDIEKGQEEVTKRVESVQTAKKKLKEGWALGNWWHGRDDDLGPVNTNCAVLIYAR